MSKHTSTWHTSVWLWLAWLVFWPGLAFLGFVSAGAVLAYPAGAPSHVDAVVVLGGDGGQRYARALEVVMDGYSKRLLLINPNEPVVKAALSQLRGVQVQFDNSPHNSWEEAKAVRTRMLANGWKSVLVVSDPPHMLRLKYAFGSNFWGSDLSYTLIATNPSWWSAQGWWQNKIAKDFVISEVQKLGYYVLHYRFGLW